jgi:FkbM family methyltransferase
MIKRIVFKIMCNQITGWLILFLFKDRLPNLRYSRFRFDITKANIDKKLIASIFWGFYESAEIRFVEKYFDGQIDAIELGASSGIVSSHIVSKFQNRSRRLVGVEANKILSETWHKNVERHKQANVNIDMLNNAIHYGAESVSFAASNNTTESRVLVGGTNSGEVVKVNSISLGELVRNQSLLDYALFCDIEGAELQIFLNETDSLINCKQLFIELHESYEGSKKFAIDDINMLIQKKGFLLVERHGPVFYYNR